MLPVGRAITPLGLLEIHSKNINAVILPNFI
jgi:hypothetical protein